jgi:hypothetical protein
MATMSKQHYEHLASTLGRAVAVEACEGGGDGSRAAGAAYRVALAVADSLADTSPRYDHCRFMDAVDKHAATAAALLSGGTISADRGAGFCLHDATMQRRAGCPSSSRINV